MESEPSCTPLASKHRWPEIDGLRGLLATGWLPGIVSAFQGSLILLNTPTNSPAQLLNGTTAVAVFIIISGYVVAHVLLTGSDRGLSFIIRRFFRIWPAHIVVLSIAAYYYWVLTPTEANLANIARHYVLEAFMLNGLVPLNIMNEPNYINPPDWSISLEWQFYLLAPLLLGGIGANSATQRLLGLAAVIHLGSGIPMSVAPAWGGERIVFQFNSFVGQQLGYFAIGILSWHLVRVFGGKLHTPWVAGLSLTVAAVGFGSTHHLSLALFIWFFFLPHLLAKDGSALVSVLRSRPLQALGAISYSIYICHMPILYWLRYSIIDVHYKIEWATSAYFLKMSLFAVPAVLIGAVGLYWLVERPGIRLGRSLAQNVKRA